MAAAAVRVAAGIFGPIADQRLLLVGSGDLIELYAAGFCDGHPRQVTVASRIPEEARRFAGRMGGKPIMLGELPEQLALHDVVVACTAGPLPVVGKGMVERALRSRKHRPILIVDLLAPRGVEPEVVELDDVFLLTRDELADSARDEQEMGRPAGVGEGVESLVH